MQIGQLDRLVRFQQPTLGTDAEFGAASTSWATQPEEWANVVEYYSPGEAAKSGLATLKRPHRITVRWRAEVRTDWRLLLDDGTLLQINGMAQVGRQRWLVLSCSEWKHQQA